MPEQTIDTTGVKYLTDDDLALWHSQIPNHVKASQVMQGRLRANWIEEHAERDPDILVTVHLIRKGILELLQAWVGVEARGRTDIVNLATGRNGQTTQRTDLSNYTPGQNLQTPTTIVNVIPQNGNGKKPTVVEKIGRVGLK